MKNKIILAAACSLILCACAAQDKDDTKLATLTKPESFALNYNKPNDQYKRFPCDASYNGFLRRNFSDLSDTLMSNLNISLLLGDTSKAKVSFEIYAIGTEPKTMALSFGEQFCWKLDTTWTWSIQYHDFETLKIEPEKWQAFESTAELWNLASGGSPDYGLQVRLVELSSFKIRNLKLTQPTGEVSLLIP
jgi:hypothetical protein